ncbi:AAA family ATPase, partial [Kitasatospora herbaricolor]|uniref:AAA family ATPase n=1 Tax=Kitasatospora herbaricolor TaxID=68217 RepID=UPI0036DA920B
MRVSSLPASPGRDAPADATADALADTLADALADAPGRVIPVRRTVCEDHKDRSVFDPTSPGRSGWGITVTDDAANPPSAPLFGRDRARETVLLVAHRALGQGGALLVTGEAGLGKTALLADIAERLEGWTVLRVHADSFESDLSYSTVERLVRGLNALSGTRVPVPRPDDEPITVGRLLLDAIDAVRSPVCVVVDDAQWVDEASARALRFVVRRLAEQSFLFAAASRPVANSVVALFDDVSATTVNHARIELTPLT